MSAELSIGEVARRAGLRASAIRYYERMGVLPAPRRARGRRSYDPAVLDGLAMIRFARHLGFTLAEIRSLLAGGIERPHPERWRELAHRRLRELDALIARAQGLRGLLQDAMRAHCPKLVERGNALQDAVPAPPPARGPAQPRSGNGAVGRH